MSTDLRPIEKIQHKFLRFISYKIHKPILEICHNYDTILATILEQRRFISDLSLT